MKEKDKKFKKVQIGVYGGEVNGANPPDWTLLSTICAQLREAGYYAEWGVLSDNSGSWLQFSELDTSKIKEASTYLVTVISFNAAGSIITAVRTYKASRHLTAESTTLLKP